MVGIESIRAWVQGLDGVEEHELHERPPWQNDLYDVSGQYDSSSNRQQARLDTGNVTPSQEESTGQNGSPSSLLPNESAHSHDLPPSEFDAGLGVRHCLSRKKKVFRMVTFSAFAVVFGITVWLFTRQAEQGLKYSMDCGEQALRGQSLSLPLTSCKPQPPTTVFTAIAGFYIIPATTVADDWFRVKRDSLPMVTGESFIDRSSVVRETLTFSTAQESSPDMSSRKGVSRSSGFEWRFDQYPDTRSEEASFQRWGVGLLYQLHRRTLSHAMRIKNQWCMDNTCSPAHRLKEMCNTTGKEKEKKVNKDRFERQECDWCWDEKIFPERNTTQQVSIQKHCKHVAAQSVIMLVALCGFACVLLLALAIILIVRKLSDRKRKRADREPQRVKENLMDPNNEPRDYGPRGGVPIMPAASGPWNETKSLNSKRMGYGSLTGLGQNRDKEKISGSPRRYTRRSKLMSSGSQHIPLGTMSRKPFVAKQGESEADLGVALGSPSQGH